MSKMNLLSNRQDIKLSSLENQFHAFLQDIDFNADDTMDASFKFRGVLLIAEIFDYARYFHKQRLSNLESYFGDQTLKECLHNVVRVEALINSFAKVYLDFLRLDKNEKDFSCEYQEIEQFYKQGEDCLTENNHYFKSLPKIDRLGIWGRLKQDHHSHKFRTVFHKAQESLDEDLSDKNMLSPDPEDMGYNRVLCHQKLGDYNVKKAEDVTYCKHDFDFLSFIVDIQKKAQEATFEELAYEIVRGLEVLRRAFMAEAQDVYYVRTEDYDGFKTEANAQMLDYYYSDVPLEQYFQQRLEEKVYIEDELVTDIYEWRILQGNKDSNLDESQVVQYLKERRERVLQRMKEDYPKLWKLRLHCGGLNSTVNPQNFARMFYRRENVDQGFIALQWELEVLNEKLKEHSTHKNEESVALTPEEVAVNAFISKICRFANDLHSDWNGKLVIPAVHQAQVEIIIKNDELTEYLQNLKNSNFNELKDWCYPENSKSKARFCEFVVQLKEKGYFGLLPNNLIAPVLAPIVGLAEGTVTNYLSSEK